MTEKQKDCILEIQDLMLAINAVVKKHDLEDEFISCLAVGFLDMESSYVDEDGAERASMSLMSSFAVADEEELDDMLSYCVEAYRAEKKEDPDTSNIDYWINLANGDDSIN
jgi:hypothetical protein